MSKLTDRVSYLKGLAEGMKLDANTDEHKLLMAIIDVLDDTAKEMSDMADAYDELNEYTESIDDDLAEVEDVLFGDEEDDEDDDEDEDEDEDEDDDEEIAYTCPHCGAELHFHASEVNFDDEMLCPHCNKPVFPEMDDNE